MPLSPKSFRNADAKNRSWRTFLVGMSIDVAVGVTLVLVSTFASADGWGSIQWIVLSFSVAKSFVQSAGAYVLRRFLDPSRIPTPLPPADPGPPADPALPDGGI